METPKLHAKKGKGGDDGGGFCQKKLPGENGKEHRERSKRKNAISYKMR